MAPVRVIFSYYFFISINIVTFIVVSAKFPNDPKPCSYGDCECIKKVTNFIFQEKIDGYPSLNIVSLNPLKVKEIVIKQDEKSPVFIDLKFQNCELFGFKGAKASLVRGFGKDIAQSHEIVLETKAINMLSDYTIKGKVLVLPISGTGRSNITMENLKMTLTLIGEPLLKNSKTYMHVKKLKLDIETSRLRFDFKNLFNGDKALSDNMNLFLNENWRDIFVEVKTPITSAFAAVWKAVINNVFENYPYDMLFTDM